MWFAEILTELFLEIEDLKFWKKKKARRKLEKEKGLSKKLMIEPSTRYYITAVLMAIILLCIYLFIVSPIIERKAKLETKEKISVLKEIINSSYINNNQFPANLSDIINNNPLERNKITDEWNNEFYYELSKDKLKYILISKGKDGELETIDDIK